MARETFSMEQLNEHGDEILKIFDDESDLACTVDPIVKTKDGDFLKRQMCHPHDAGEGRSVAQSSAARRSGAAALPRIATHKVRHVRGCGPATITLPRYTSHGV